MRARAQVWDSVTLECLRTLEGHEDNVRVLAVGDKYVFSGSWDKSIRCGLFWRFPSHDSGNCHTCSMVVRVWQH